MQRGVLMQRFHKYLPAISLFLLFLVFFFFRSSLHIPSQLVIAGHADMVSEGVVRWDSGEGYNDMELEPVIFGMQAKSDQKPPIITIKRTGKKNEASTSTDVWITAIDNPIEGVKFSQFDGHPGVEIGKDGILHMTADDSEIRFPAGGDRVHLLFKMNASSGVVEIDVAGDKRHYDLYALNPQEKLLSRDIRTFSPGDFVIRVDLPRFDIRAMSIACVDKMNQLKIYSLGIESKKGTVKIPVADRGSLSQITFSAPDLHRNTQQYFDPLLFMQQGGFAALCTYIVLSLLRFVERKGGWNTLLHGPRKAFWFMSSGAFFCFLLWLLAYWPGHFTSDSIHIWWAAKNPDVFLHEHPLMNIIYYRFLQQFWDHFAAVGVFQILVTALLGSYIFYDLHKKGLSWWFIMPFYLWFVTSVPVGLFNITLWKDIPFALTVLFWSYFFVKLNWNRTNGVTTEIHRGRTALFLLLLCSCLFRYNGLIYLVLIPLGLVLYREVSLKKMAWLILSLLLIFSVVVIWTSRINRNSDFVVGLGKKIAVNLWHANFQKNTIYLFNQYPKILDNRNRNTWYRDNGVVRWHYTFTRENKYHEFVKFYPYEPKSVKLHGVLNRLVQASHESPLVYLSWNPAFILFLLPLCFLYKFFPFLSAYGYLLWTQMLALLIFLQNIQGPMHHDWRYYYYLVLAGFFLIPILLLDLMNKKKMNWLRAKSAFSQ
jgi:hypothetical protein